MHNYRVGFTIEMLSFSSIDKFDAPRIDASAPRE